MGSIESHEPLKLENFAGLVPEVRCEELTPSPALLVLKVGEEAMCQGTEWPLEAGNGPQFTVGKKTGALVLPPEGTEFCQLLVKLSLR